MERAAVEIAYRDEGVTPYPECWKLQQGIFDSLVAAKDGSRGEQGGGRESTGSEGSDAGVAPKIGSETGTKGGAVPTLILCEHPHVYTLGKSGRAENLLMTEDFLHGVGASVYRIDRGGDITYHGPGQLVGYPVVDLEGLGLGLKEYVHLLEESVVETIAEFGIEGVRSEGATGVWLRPETGKGWRKISAIGVRSSRYVTMHGFSLNVAPAMEYFTYINPCGFTDRGVTSIAAETGSDPGIGEVKRVYREKFQSVFNVRLL